VQWLLFIHAWFAHTEKFFDLAGSLTYVTIFIAALVLSSAYDPRSLILAAVIIIWALRLGPFLYFRIKNAGGDRRFHSIRNSFPTFFMTWTLQGSWVYLTSCAALAAVTSSLTVGLDALFFVGLGIWGFGFGVEVIADRQKSAFRANPENAHRFIQTGLWAWSRHPNYFGEILLWAGVAVMAYPALVGWQILTLFAPLWVLLQMTAISGTRMLEARANKTWGHDPDYQAYKKTTPMLMLWPPRKPSP
jgi:steroid 5-alpha reductase family enzyme